jgi:hypothetical protein
MRKVVRGFTLRGSGPEDGHDLEDWLLAEEEIMERRSATSPPDKSERTVPRCQVRRNDTRSQIPSSVDVRCLQYVQTAVIGTNLIKDVLRAIPLVQYLRNHVSVQAKANGSLVCLSPRVAMHLYLHLGPTVV